MPHVLVIESERNASACVATWIAEEGHTVAVVASLRDAKRQIILQHPGIVLLAETLPDGSADHFLEEAKSLPPMEIVLLTDADDPHTARQAIERGAVDHVAKPVTRSRLMAALTRLSKPCPMRGHVRSMEDSLEAEGHFGELWGRSPAMRQVYEQISRVACTGVTVFIAGESGTGKEVVARTVHTLSRRNGRPFLAVNCGAISPQLIESEIFGHEKGSFTGADRQHHGFFERADGGTLFLDEITEMPLDLQVKLLRVLETGHFMRVGSTTSRSTDVRLITATNRDPLQAVQAGRLREDLFYRINVFPIHLAPLRERAEDVELLAEHFLQELSEREGLRKQFAPSALQRLAACDWPGNVRELRNVVCRAYVMANDTIITDPCLPAEQAFASEPDNHAAPSLTFQVGMALADVERRVTLATLEHLGRHKEKTAATLGISLKTLYNRLKEYAASGDCGPVTEPAALEESR